MKEISINPTDLTWEKAENYPEGTMLKMLRRSSHGNPLTALLKLPPGFVMDDHSHVYAEHHYVLEGEYQVKDERFNAGHYRMIPEHADHGPFRSETGAVVLVIWESSSAT